MFILNFVFVYFYIQSVTYLYNGSFSHERTLIAITKCSSFRGQLSSYLTAFSNSLQCLYDSALYVAYYKYFPQKNPLPVPCHSLPLANRLASPLLCQGVTLLSYSSLFHFSIKYLPLTAFAHFPLHFNNHMW